MPCLGNVPTATQLLLSRSGNAYCNVLPLDICSSAMRVNCSSVALSGISWMSVNQTFYTWHSSLTESSVMSGRPMNTPRWPFSRSMITNCSGNIFMVWPSVQ